MRSCDGGDFLLISVQSSVVEATIEGDEVVIVVLLPTRVVGVGSNLVTSDDGSNTTAGSALTRRNGEHHRLGSGRDDGQGSGEGQSESREVLHGGVGDGEMERERE